MDAYEALEHDVRNGQISLRQIIDLLRESDKKCESAQRSADASQKNLDEQQKENQRLKTEIEQLKQALDPTTEPIKQLDQAYSMKAEEKREEQRTGRRKKRKESKKKRRGRISNEEKLKQAHDTRDVFPDGIDISQCVFSHVRLVWRIEAGVARLIAYRIFRGPGKQYGSIPGVLGKGGFGIEIIVKLSYMVHVSGLSFDKACDLLKFVQNLPMSKSQADALMYRLSRQWEQEFEVLCVLLANSLVVHADETSWSINSVWTFLSEKVRLLLFGVHKDAATLKAILDPETFAGICFSDDAAVYANFTHAQKCWAHLLRKAIKLTLKAPENEEYKTFMKELLNIYHRAQSIRKDKRLGESGRFRKIQELEKELLRLCRFARVRLSGSEGLERDFCLLATELTRLALKQELFTFVEKAGETVDQPNGEPKAIDGTNNEAERILRGPAQARDTGRTSKTPKGARRSSVLKSVLESLRLYLPTYNLQSLIDEIMRWQEVGRSCFQDLLETLGLKVPDDSVLDEVLPDSTG